MSVDGVFDAGCVEDVADRSFLVSSSALELGYGYFAGRLLFICPLEGWFELHFDLVFTLCEVPVPLVALFDGRRRVPAWGVGLRFDEDALAAHVFFGEVQVWAVDWAGCKEEVWHAACSSEPTADEGVFVSRH